MKPQGRSLLGTDQLTPTQINSFLKLAKSMDPRRAPQWLRGKRVVLLFYEASTRTRTSFEFAAKALGATTTLITSSASSIEKGESLIDTGWTVTSLGADIIVMRHPCSGAPYLLSRFIPTPVVNAGDGLHQHPSQALLDALTMVDHKKKLKGLRVAIVGDIFHSRVARSDVHLLSKAGAHVTLCGPEALVPEVATTLAKGVSVTRDLKDAITGADVVIALRIQKERLAGLQLSLDDYVGRYQLTAERVRWAMKDAIVMHPGPIIRGLELTADVADAERTVIVEQVKNGVAVRMAILARALGVKH
jgi:aspartate carbamoyltransferase catalytic subunit